MLTDIEVEKIKVKMKKTYTTSAMLGRQLGVSRQMVNGVLHQRFVSERIENELRAWNLKN